MFAAVIASLFTLAFAPTNATLSSAAGVPVTCSDDASWATSYPAAVGKADGLYDTYNHLIVLRSVECDRLQLLISGARPRNIQYQYDLSSALFVFGHEIAHARGVDDEAAADCAAGKHFLATAASIGVGNSYARVLSDYLVNARIPQRCYPR